MLNFKTTTLAYFPIGSYLGMMLHEYDHESWLQYLPGSCHSCACSLVQAWPRQPGQHLAAFSAGPARQPSQLGS